MPERLQHTPKCDSVPWEEDELGLHMSIAPHPDRHGCVTVTWYEQCARCNQRLSYTTDVVARRNVLKHLRSTAMIYHSTWTQREGRWGDQPLPEMS
jgi:hypothetical protein